MLNKLKTYLQGWGFMRTLLLILGIIVIGQAITTWDAILGLMGAFLIAMPLFNIGCCGSGGCYTSINNTNNDKQIDFEEVVIKK